MLIDGGELGFQAFVEAMFDATVKHMAERAKISGVRGDEPQQIGNADPWQLAIERAVDRFRSLGILQRPATLLGGTGDFDVGVQTVSDVLIDGGELGVQAFVESLQRVLNRCQ